MNIRQQMLWRNNSPENNMGIEGSFQMLRTNVPFQVSSDFSAALGTPQASIFPLFPSSYPSSSQSPLFRGVSCSRSCLEVGFSRLSPIQTPWERKWLVQLAPIIQGGSSCLMPLISQVPGWLITWLALGKAAPHPLLNYCDKVLG